MIDLASCQAGEAAQLMREEFRYIRDSFSNFEEAAQAFTQISFQNFQTECEPTFALIRIFRTFNYWDLPYEMQREADPKIDMWLALMGTYGLERQWCSRNSSKNHFLVPLAGNVAPMFRAAFSGIQIPVGEDDTMPEYQRGQALTDVFYVENALGSPVITDQAEFVQPYGIQSVVGIGSTFLSGQAYLGLFFSRLPLHPLQAKCLSEVSPFLSTLLALYDERQLFSV